MLARVSEEIACCYLNLIECERKAADPDVSHRNREEYLCLAQSWERLAESYELAARISSYLEWQARRLHDH